MPVLLVYLFVILLIFLGGVNASSKKVDIAWMDREHTTVCKGIAIVMVITSHLAGNYTELRVFTPLGGIGVAIFLIVSGYGIACSYRENGLKKYWMKRLRYVWIPYFLCELIAGLLLGNASIKTFVWDILLIHTRYVYGWYLQYIFLWYMFFWVVYRFVPQAKRFAAMLLIATIIFAFAPEIMAEQALSFFTGIIWADYFSQRKNMRDWKSTCCFFVLGMGMLFAKQLPVIRQSPDIIMKFVQLCIKLPLGIFFINCIYHMKKMFANKIWFFIGTISYEIYLVHGYILSMLPEASIKNGICIVLFILIISSAFYGLFFMTQKCFCYDREDARK